MTANKKEKSLARALARSQGVSYTEALRQLREARKNEEQEEDSE